MSERDEIKQVERVVLAYADAIHTQGEAEFRALWTGGEENRLISGSKLFDGVDAIYTDFCGLLHDLYESIYLVNDGIDVRMMGEDVAIVVFRYHTECVRRETGEPYGIAGLETQVLRRTEDGWKIAHIQYAGKSTT